ncbi:MAG TPA: lysine-2,3-aminomutase-like protein [Steroidobacteraceae bacterium]|nr:lysine-2,3-aminomutase-like protein [Steroidobacteraceae bacterium]
MNEPRPAIGDQGLEFRRTPYLDWLLRDRAAHDPLALQFLPDGREMNTLAYESADPIGDDAHSPIPGIVHRYPDRVLLKVAHACAVYCRFCFRREMIGSKGSALMGDALDAAIEYIRGRREVWEVILTGGDPFTLSVRRLGDIVSRLAAITHVGVIRIHSRAPVIAPDSIDGDLVRALECPLPVYVAVHVNHPEEITEPVVGALRRLSDGGIVLLSQTVLLRGVNDDASVLEMLFRRLVRLKVRPYYLHHPDLAPGTSHFRVPIEVGQALMRELRGRLSGLCQPTYVLDIPGGFGKVPVGPGYLGRNPVSGVREVLDWCGERHAYPE